MSERAVEQDDIKDRNESRSKKLSFLQYIDIFGIPIELIYKQKYKHTTRFGGVISLAIFLLISGSLYNQLTEFFYKKQPQVIFEEKIVENPARRNLTEDNFTFVLGLLDSSAIPFIDESVYNIKGEFRIREKILDPSNMNSDTQLINTTIVQLDLQRCKLENFSSESTKKYFLSLNYTNLYCFKVQDLDKNKTQVFLQGQFDNDIFSFIRLTINRCNTAAPQQQCKDDNQIDQILSRSSLQVYYTNELVEITSYDNPFKQMGQTLYWYANIDYFQRIALMYRNAHIIDDIGTLFDKFKQTVSLQFSSDRCSMNKKGKKTDLFDITIQLEKNKENFYMRFFLKWDKIASLIGGMFNILIVFGSLITKPYSKLELIRKLINSTFDFSFSKKEFNSQQDNQSEIKQSQNTAEPDVTPNINIVKNSFQQVQLNHLGNDKNNNMTKNKLNKKKFNKSEIDQIENIKKAQTKNYPQINKIIQNKDESQNKGIKEKQDELTIKNYIQSIISKYIRWFSSDKTKMIEYSEEKIRLFTDVRYIINKLVELDKLKMLLLNENYLQLFNIIQKPLVDINNICNEKFKQKKIVSEANHNLQLNNVNELYRSNIQQVSRNADQALKDLYFRKQNNQKLNKIDLKLVKLVDMRRISKFINQTETQKNVNLSQSTCQPQNSNIDKSISFNYLNFKLNHTSVNAQPENNIFTDSLISQKYKNLKEFNFINQKKQVDVKGDSDSQIQIFSNEKLDNEFSSQQIYQLQFNKNPHLTNSPYNNFQKKPIIDHQEKNQ